ncbi:MAG: hypothetical protein AAFW70_27305, partial [Cyanobacteria bacterium J06635_10]
MQLLEKSTYSQTQNVDANPTKHLETSTSEYLHASFLLWEYKNHYSKKEYRQLLQEYRWDKGKTEEKRALKIAENFQNFAYRPQALFQIPVTTLLRLCSDKYKPIIQELETTEQEITFSYVTQLIKDRAAQLKKEKESQLPQKPSIWKRNCRQERYVAFPPLYEDDHQTGVLTQKLMDDYGLIPQNILRRAIADLYQKIAEGEQDESTAHDMDVVDNASGNNGNDYNQQQPNEEQTVEDKWQELNQQLKVDINSNGEVSQEIGQLIFESCQAWEATVPTDKRWSAIANIAAHNGKLLKHLSDYAYSNHSEWKHSWGAMLASSDNLDSELEWVPSAIRIDALIAMGYKIPATVEVTAGDYEGKQGRIVELQGDTAAPILVECDDFQEYFHWNELEIITEAETFTRYNTLEELQESQYLEEPEESDIELESTPLDKAIDTLINGDWKDIRDIFNEHPEIKEEAWNALSSEQKRRVVDITPET